MSKEHICDPCGGFKSLDRCYCDRCQAELRAKNPHHRQHADDNRPEARGWPWETKFPLRAGEDAYGFQISKPVWAGHIGSGIRVSLHSDGEAAASAVILGEGPEWPDVIGVGRDMGRPGAEQMGNPYRGKRRLDVEADLKNEESGAALDQLLEEKVRELTAKSQANTLDIRDWETFAVAEIMKQVDVLIARLDGLPKNVERRTAVSALRFANAYLRDDLKRLGVTPS